MSQSNKMSVMQLTILTAVNMMGSGIIMLPTKLAQVGALSIVSWLVTAVGSMCLAYVFAKCGMYSKKGGGMGGYAEYSFGKAGNFMANYTYGVSLVFANTAIAISAVGYACGFLGTTLNPLFTAIATIGVLWLATGPKLRRSEIYRRRFLHYRMGRHYPMYRTCCYRLGLVLNRYVYSQLECE